MIDTEYAIKNLGYLVRNPREAKYFSQQFGKNAFLNKNKHPYKKVISDLNMDFINATKVVVKKHLSQSLTYKDNITEEIISSDFLPYYDNQILFIESPDKTDENNHIGFWIRDKKTHYVISLFIYTDIGIINSVIDWGISKTKNQWEKHWNDNSSSHGKNYKLLQSWVGHKKNMFNFYHQFTKPFQHWALKNPIDNPYIKELDFENKEEILIPIRAKYYIHCLNNLKKSKDIILQEPEIREADKRNTKPLAYQFKTIDIKESKKSNFIYNRSINKNKFHTVRGFEREYKSGKKVWVKNHTRGDKSLGIIEKDYKISKPKEDKNEIHT